MAKHFRNGDWHEDIEDKPMSWGYRLLLWVLFVSSSLMIVYGGYTWVTKKVIPLVVKLGEPFPASPLELEKTPTTTTATTATTKVEATTKIVASQGDIEQ